MICAGAAAVFTDNTQGAALAAAESCSIFGTGSLMLVAVHIHGRLVLAVLAMVFLKALVLDGGVLQSNFLGSCESKPSETHCEEQLQ